jgi:hypothetical protein
MLSELACGKQGQMSQVGWNYLVAAVELGIGHSNFPAYSGKFVSHEEVGRRIERILRP